MNRLRVTIILGLLLCSMPAVAKRAEIQRHPHAVPGRFMVLLDLKGGDYDLAVRKLAQTHQFEVVAEWREGAVGFVCDGLTEQSLQRLADQPEVVLIEEDFTFSLQSGVVSTGGVGPDGEDLWYLDRVDEYYNVRDNSYDMCPDGSEVTAYILDTGVRDNHDEFMVGSSSRVTHRYFFEDGSRIDEPAEYCGGMLHGTAVASVLAGNSVGASRAKIVSLRYANCQQFAKGSDLVAAVNFVGSEADVAEVKGLRLVNFSGGVGKWQGHFAALNTAVKALVDERQVPFFTSAENFAGDACMFAPNNLAYANAYGKTGGHVFVTAGTTPDDRRWQRRDANGQYLIGQGAGSNGGACVSAYAPATDFVVAYGPYPEMTAVMTGTSFSSPLAAGVAARWMAANGVSAHTARNVYSGVLASRGVNPTGTSTTSYYLCINPTSGLVAGSSPDLYSCPQNTQTWFVNSTSTTRPMLYSNRTCP